MTFIEPMCSLNDKCWVRIRVVRLDRPSKIKGSTVSSRPARSAPTSCTSTASMFASLRSKNFRIFLSGQLISNIGSWTQRIAQDWLVLTLTGSATAVGITTALQFLPTVALGPIGGLIADRYCKRRILLATATVMGCCAATLAVLVLRHQVHLWQIYSLAMVLGMAAAVDNPTRQSFANDLVGPSRLRNAISLNSAVFQLGALIGPAISGVLIGAVGIGSAFVVNAASFAGSLVALAVLRPAGLNRTAPAARERGQVRAAISHLIGRPEMRYPTILAGVFAFFTMSFPVTMASFSHSVFHSGSTGFALLTSLMAGGSVVGSLMAARHSPFRLRGLVALAGALAAAQLLAAFAPNPATLGVLLVGLGVCVVMFGIAANSTVQLAAGDHIRGRILGLYLMVVMGAGCAGGPAVGTIDELLGPRAGLLLGGLIPGTLTLVLGLRLAHSVGIAAMPALRSKVRLVSHRPHLAPSGGADPSRQLSLRRTASARSRDPSEPVDGGSRRLIGAVNSMTRGPR